MAGDLSFDDLVPAGSAPISAAPVAASAPQGDLAFDDLVPAPKPVSSQAADVAQSFGGGLAKGAVGLATSPVTLPKMGADALVSGADWVARKLMGLGPPTAQDLAAQAKAAAAMPNYGVDQVASAANASVDAAVPSPQTTAGHYAQTIGEFAPNLLLGPGGLARRAVTEVALPAAASEAAGQATQGTALEPYARMAGAVGGNLGAALSTRAVTPFPLAPERAAQVASLQGEGVPLTAGQITGNKPLRYAESVLSEMPGAGGGAAAMDEAQRDAFTRAALQRIGVDSPVASPDVLANARGAIGAQFNDLSSRNTLRFDPQMGQDIGQAIAEYDNLLPVHQRDAVMNLVNDIVQRPGGQMSGEMYQQTRSTLGRQANAISQSDPAYSRVLGGIQGALDGAMARSISPEDQAAWQQARDRWRNLQVIQQAATSAGENAAQGSISPASLRSAVVGQNRTAYATGQGDLSDLARSGVALMSPLPNSGTAGRQGMQHLLGLGSIAVGAHAGGLEGIAAGYAAPSIFGRMIMSRPGQAYLTNQVMAAPDPNSMLGRMLMLNSAGQTAAAN